MTELHHPPADRPVPGPHWLRVEASAHSGGPLLRLRALPAGWAREIAKPGVILGRHSSAGFRLPLPDVSRKHCQVSYQRGMWTIEDLGSLNGTYLNGEKLTAPTPLKPRDQLQIGEYTFQVEFPLQPSEVALPGHLQSIANALPDPEREVAN